jgi:hypothetical protein
MSVTKKDRLDEIIVTAPGFHAASTAAHLAASFGYRQHAARSSLAGS